MSDKKIVVPDGMLKVAKAGLSWRRDDTFASQVERILRSALEWLSENPIVPTDEDANDIWIEGLKTERVSPTGHACKDMLIEWQRRMFLAPEPEIRPLVRNALRGVTLTHEEAEYLKKEIDSITHPGMTTVSSRIDGNPVPQAPFPPNSSIYPQFFVDSRVPPGEIRLNGWDGPVLMKNIGNPDKENK